MRKTLVQTLKVFGVLGLIAVFSACQSKPSSTQSSSSTESASSNTMTPPPEYQTSGESSSASSQSSSTQSVNPATDKGIGPIKNLQLSPNIDKGLAEKGKTLFQQNCSMCHKLNQRYVGPALGDVAKKATPEFIMNMMLNTKEMLDKDPVAHNLEAEYGAQMAVNVNQDQARAILEYLREVAEGGSQK